MKILVCVKQVPGSNNVEVDPVTGVLKRSGIPSKINPYDLYAIETALSLAERFGGTVESLTMGPPQAKSVIQETVCMGVQKGTVLTDRKFAGADVLATAYTISQGIRKCGEYDLIICGKQTTDGDTAQVGAEVAEYLGLPKQPTRLLSPWDFPGKSTRVGCHFLLQGIFPTQGSNPGLPRCCY